MYLSYEQAGFTSSFGANSLTLASFLSLLCETFAETLLGHSCTTYNVKTLKNYRQAFSQNLKSGHQKWAIGPAQISNL